MEGYDEVILAALLKQNRGSIAGVIARKFLIFLHRWLGLAFCLLFLTWFLSGVVMMYATYPSVSAKERLDRSEALRSESVQISPQDAYLSLKIAQRPKSIVLINLGGRPAYRFQTRRAVRMVYADNGELAGQVNPVEGAKLAAAWITMPASTASFKGTLTEADQWTLGSQFAALRPLLKFGWPDGEEAYVSVISGEVVQHTTRTTRALAYLGAIPHWLYFAPLRRNGRLWNKVVIWSSGIGTITSLLGLVVGILLYSPSKRYLHQGQPSGIPYRGQKHLHVILGLVFGLVTCSWVFSGLLSMEPFPWLSDESNSASLVAEMLQGNDVNPTLFAAKSPHEVLRQVGSAKELELIEAAGQPYYVARPSPDVSQLVPMHGEVFDRFDPKTLRGLVARAVNPAQITEAHVMTQYDAYYLDRERQHPLPALFVEIGDVDRSMLYIDLKTARLVEAYGRRSRINRWLYHGLHSWNLPWLYRYRPAWDIFVLLLLAGGIGLSTTSVVLSVQLIQRKLFVRREHPA